MKYAECLRKIYSCMEDRDLYQAKVISGDSPTQVNL